MPLNNLIVSPLTPVPVIVGLLLLFGVVIVSIVGADGGVVSYTVTFLTAVTVVPATSVTEYVTV